MYCVWQVVKTPTVISNNPVYECLGECDWIYEYYVLISCRGVQPTRCKVSQSIYFCKTLYMFQTGFPSIISNSKLHMQLHVFVRPILLPAANLARLAAGSSIGLYVQFWAPDDGRKNRLKHVQRLTEINKLWNVASCWLYCANILAMDGPMNVKFHFFTHVGPTCVCQNAILDTDTNG